MKTNRLLTAAASLIAALTLSQCAQLPDGSSAGGSYALPKAARAAQTQDGAQAEAAAYKERPGLGTRLGHEIHDSTRAAHFFKTADGLPDSVATFHYNDDEGAKLMARQHGRAARRSGAFDLAPGKLRARVTTTGWQAKTLSHYAAGGKVFVIGKPDAAYAIQLENTGKERVMVVVSVDGLDVLNGKPASTRNPGYVIEAGGALTVRGMKAGGKLREFHFASVAESRAATAFGESGARNVGVIGVALFEEDSKARRRALLSEGDTREDARAFSAGS